MDLKLIRFLRVILLSCGILFVLSFFFSQEANAVMPMKGYSYNITPLVPPHHPVLNGRADSWCEWGHASRYPDWFRSGAYFNAGFFYHEHREGWIATTTYNDPTGKPYQTMYPGVTYFIAHDIEGERIPSTFNIFRSPDPNDWNVMEFNLLGHNVKCWILGQGDTPDDTKWINQTDGLQYSHLIPEGPGNNLLIDVGFIVRYNNDPSTDRHWFPGMTEPGDPAFNWSQWYGAFGYYGFNNSFWATGIDQRLPSYHDEDDNEVYEWAFYWGAPNGGAGGDDVVIFPPNIPAPPMLDSLQFRVVVVDPPKDTLVFIAPNWWIHFIWPGWGFPGGPGPFPPGVEIKEGPDAVIPADGTPFSVFFQVRNNCDPERYGVECGDETRTISVTAPPGWGVISPPSVSVGPCDPDQTNTREWQILEVLLTPPGPPMPYSGGPVTMTLTNEAGETESATVMVLAPGPEYFQGYPGHYPPEMALWHDPLSLAYLNGGDPVESWPDRTTAWVAEDAEMRFDYDRQPKFVNPGLPPSGFPGVLFETDYDDYAYGKSDGLAGPYNLEITSGNPDRWFPEKQDKSLFIVFSPGTPMAIGDPPHPYYSDGRQTLFEAGGPLSGMNVYIENARLCFGMWNRFQQQFLLHEPPVPLIPGNTYLAQLEYNSEEQSFRVMIGDPEGNVIPSPVLFKFRGLTQDDNDNTGLGCAARTRYHDYSTGETYSDHYNGIMGDVMMFDSFFDVFTDLDMDQIPDINEIYSFINERYRQTWQYPSPGQIPKQNEWIVIQNDEIEEESLISQAYPNPFTTVTNVSLYVPSDQNVYIELFDIYGKRIQLVHSGQLPKGIYDFTIDGTGLPSGMYVVRAKGDNFIKSVKIILNK